MKVLWEKHKIVLTLFVMVGLAGSGFASLMTMSGVSALFIIWSFLTILGLAFFIIAGIALVASKTGREQWQKILLAGLWLLLVSGGSCGMLWALITGASVVERL